MVVNTSVEQSVLVLQGEPMVATPGVPQTPLVQSWPAPQATHATPPRPQLVTLLAENWLGLQAPLGSRQPSQAVPPPPPVPVPPPVVPARQT